VTTRRSSTPTVRRTLTLTEFERARGQLGRAIARRRSAWGSHGWAVVGPPRSLRIEIAVPRTLLRPDSPIGAVPLPRAIGGSIKLSARSSFRRATPPSEPSALVAATTSAIAEAYAPGSRILVNSNPVEEAGVACFVIADDVVHMLTCGPPFQPRAVGTAVFAANTKVATLSHNFLDDDEQLDIACCQVTPAGLQLAAASANAPSWCTEILPAIQGQHQPAVFWPTNAAASDAVTTTINSYSASESGLSNRFWDLELDQLIRTEGITLPGDSGSLLMVRDRYYAACTGKPDSWSYYTPLHHAMERLRNLFTQVDLWLPG